MRRVLMLALLSLVLAGCVGMSCVLDLEKAGAAWIINEGRCDLQEED